MILQLQVLSPYPPELRESRWKLFVVPRECRAFERTGVERKSLVQFEFADSGILFTCRFFGYGINAR